MSFDRVTILGDQLVVCTYDVDLREVRGEEAGRGLVAIVRARVAAGRAERPDAAAHHVHVLLTDDTDEVARGVVLSSLGDRDGVDSVAVFGASLEEGSHAADADASASAAEAPSPSPAWSKLESAIALDRAILAGEDVRVDVDGAEGSLALAPEDWPIRVGEQVRVRVVMLNVRMRRATFVLAPT